MSTHVLGLPGLLAGFSRAVVAAEASEEAAEEVVGVEVAETAKTLAPVDTGALRDSIVQVPEGVAVEAPYAVFVEYGTSDSSAQPFVRPAIDESHATTAAAAVASVMRTV